MNRDDRKRKRDARITLDTLKQSLAISFTEETAEVAELNLKLAIALEEEEMLKLGAENCQRKEEELNSLKSQIEGLAKQYYNQKALRQKSF